MLLSKIEKERLAEASISLAEIKATKKIILEELSVPNEDIRKKLLAQINKHVRIYGQNLKPTFEKTEAKTLVKFVDNLIANSEICARRLTDEMDDKQFYADLEVITSWHNLGLALAYFLKKIPNVIAGFKTFYQKAEAVGPNSEERIFEIFSDEEQNGMIERFKKALQEPIRILAVVSDEEMEDKAKELRQANGKFEDVTATITEFVEMIKKSYSNKAARAADVGIRNEDFGTTDPIDLDPNTIISELIDSKFSSVNALLGNKKLKKISKKTPLEQIKIYLSPPGEEGSPHAATPQYVDAMKKLSEEINAEIGTEIDTDNMKNFVKEVLKLLQDGSVDEAKMLKMIEDSKK